MVNLTQLLDAVRKAIANYMADFIRVSENDAKYVVDRMEVFQDPYPYPFLSEPHEYDNDAAELDSDDIVIEIAKEMSMFKVERGVVRMIDIGGSKGV